VSSHLLLALQTRAKLALTYSGGGAAGYVLTSTDSGATWVSHTLSGATSQAVEVASSADGSKLVAAVAAHIYTSTDSGVTWTQRQGAGTGDWTHVSSSADGITLCASSGTYGYIYTSTDSGVAWTERTSMGAQLWGSLVCTADGSGIYATNDSGQLFASTDGGATWSTVTSLGAHDYVASVTVSANGTRLAVASDYIYTSDDSGVTWRKEASAVADLWMVIASSSDGSKLIAGSIHFDTGTGYLYTGQAMALGEPGAQGATGATGPAGFSVPNSVDWGFGGDLMVRTGVQLWLSPSIAITPLRLSATLGSLSTSGADVTFRLLANGSEVTSLTMRGDEPTQKKIVTSFVINPIPPDTILSVDIVTVDASPAPADAIVQFWWEPA